MSNLIFLIATICYLLIGIFYIIDLVFKKFKNDTIPLIVLAVVFVVHLIGLIIRAIQSGHTPLSNVYETMVFFSWLIILISFFVRFKYNIKSMVGISSLLAFISIGAASVLPENLRISQPLVPALQSWWLEIHVLTCFVAYAAFAIAFGASIMFLIRNYLETKKKQVSAKFPGKDSLDDLSYRLIAIGFFFLTLGILTGAVWAKYAWGQYWGWDPKETWALVTLLVYAVYLHTRFLKNWKGLKSSWLSVIGFIAVLFTYFGVNFLLSGLHSYA